MVAKLPSSVAAWLLLGSSLSDLVTGTPVFISELHYDNAGVDTGEAVEIFGPAGTNLNNWEVLFYNGASGSIYDKVTLSGIIVDQVSGFGTLGFFRKGIQNGPSSTLSATVDASGVTSVPGDGLALVDASGSVVQFLSYEGSFMALDGTAIGLTSSDIGVSQSSDTPLDFSLKLAGEGTEYEDFFWDPVATLSSFGDVNMGMSTGIISEDGSGSSVFISELHYNNVGSDEGEAVEIFGPAGVDLGGWSIALYNGANGDTYGSIPLSGVIPAQARGYGTLSFAYDGLQNGNADGLALLNGSGTVVQFLSYQGSMKASEGPAAGLDSEDIGVSESSSSPVGTSLQLEGMGTSYGGLTWRGGRTQSFGAINSGMADLEAAPPAPGGGKEEEEEEEEVANGVPPRPAPPSAQCDSLRVVTIGDVQGEGSSSPLLGKVVTIRGVVTGVFPKLSGFFVQDAGDGKDMSSDGIFVSSELAVTVEQDVAVTGVVVESYGQTQIEDVEDVALCTVSRVLPSPVRVSLPSSEGILEALEGMVVTVVAPVVVENYDMGVYGELRVGGSRLFQFTQVNKPGALPESVPGTTIIVDDGSTDREPNPNIYLDKAADFRTGQTLDDPTGCLGFSFGSFRLEPTATVQATSVPTNPRPTEVPPPAEGTVRVASFNVLNFFMTLGSRGANTVQGRENQLAKLTAGAVALNADIIGIVEVENNYGQPDDASRVLVESMNRAASDADWDYVLPSTIPLGSDLIAVGLFYNKKKVALKGTSDVLDYQDNKTRATLAQTFETVCAAGPGNCPALTVAVSHLKSKGSPCDSIGDPNLNDGQGNCNKTRLGAMQKLLAWLMPRSGIKVAYDPDVLLIGDLNSYAMEDPITEAKDNGYVDMSASDPDYPKVSSYVFKGESGTLDYILATTSAAAQRAGDLVHYHVNADEAPALEYDNCGSNDACTVSLDQYRCSDHDMVVQDFKLV